MAEKKLDTKGTTEVKGEKKIDLLATTTLIHQCLTDSVCEVVFQNNRVDERVREWTLKHLADFWIAVTLNAPPALTKALYEAQLGPTTGWPEIPQTSKQAFFERCKELRPVFFAKLFSAFRDQILSFAEPVFCMELENFRKKFPSVFALDGSRLDAIAHRLGILHNIRSVILPGCLEVCYDIFLGIPRGFHFDPDAATGEALRAPYALDGLPSMSLFLCDRLYSTPAFFQELSARNQFGLIRLKKGLTVKKIECISRRRVCGGILSDWIVEVGSGQGVPPQRLRHIHFKDKKGYMDWYTNVLDPKKFRAKDALKLYPFRWKIERMFYDLKEVLKLHCFYAGNPNAIAMQVFASAIVYTALRVAQGQAAKKAGIQAEMISTEKFFPKVATASMALTFFEISTDQIKKLNPGKRLRIPNWKNLPFASTPLKAVLLEQRNKNRRKRRFCKSRTRWKSFSHVPGGKKLLNN